MEQKKSYKSTWIWSEQSSSSESPWNICMLDQCLSVIVAYTEGWPKGIYLSCRAILVPGGNFYVNWHNMASCSLPGRKDMFHVNTHKEMQVIVWGNDVRCGSHKRWSSCAENIAFSLNSRAGEWPDRKWTLFVVVNLWQCRIPPSILFCNGN